MLSGIVESRLEEAAETTDWQLHKAYELARIHFQSEDSKVVLEIAKVLASNYQAVTQRKALSK